MFVAGALPALVLVPLLWKYLPESEAFLRARAGLGPAGDARPQARQEPGRHPVPARPARSTLAFWITSFMGLLLVYGLNTWLPQIMRSAGYELGAALALLLVLNVGAVLGLLVAGQVADRIGIRRSTMAWFAGAALFLALLSIRLPGIGVYVVRAAGRGVRVQRAGAGVRLRQPPLPGRRARHRDRRGQRLRSARRDHRPADRRLAAHRRAGLPVGLLHLRRRRRRSARCPSLLVNRDPAPDEPLPVTEDEADHLGEQPAPA